MSSEDTNRGAGWAGVTGHMHWISVSLKRVSSRILLAGGVQWQNYCTCGGKKHIQHVKELHKQLQKHEQVSRYCKLTLNTCLYN